MGIGIATRRYWLGLGCLAASFIGALPGTVQAQVPSVNGQCVLSTLLQGDTQAAGTLQSTCGQTWSGHGGTAVVARLQDGSVLVAGGDTPGQFGAIASTKAEAYLPQEGIFLPVGAMQAASYLPQFTLLGNGQVLVIDDFGTSEVYTPALLGFQKVGSPLKDHGPSEGSLTAFGQTNALLAGGWIGDTTLADAEVYHASTRSYTLTGSLNQGRFYHSAVQLADGRVLIVGGFTNGTTFGDPAARAEIYNPATGKFTLAARMITPRGNAYAVVLRDGRVLVAGGSITDFSQDLTSAEIYDPVSDTFRSTGSMVRTVPPFQFGIQPFVLPNGKVLIGDEIYDPASGSFSLAPGQPPLGGPMVMLLTGQVLQPGPYTAGPGQAYLYQPPR